MFTFLLKIFVLVLYILVHNFQFSVFVALLLTDFVFFAIVTFFTEILFIKHLFFIVIASITVSFSVKFFIYQILITTFLCYLKVKSSFFLI